MLLPLAVRIGAATARHQQVMARLQPELRAVKERFKGDPARLAAETRRLLAREQVSMVPFTGLLGALVQWPVLLALLSAVQEVAARGGSFLWVRSIARPDLMLALVATALTVAATLAGVQASAEQRWLVVGITAVVTAVMLTQMSAGVGLYWGASSAIGILQSMLIGRRRV
jgi:YidC/Oxa1 family membrane protein insertase